MNLSTQQIPIYRTEAIYKKVLGSPNKWKM